MSRFFFWVFFILLAPTFGVACTDTVFQQILAASSHRQNLAKVTAKETVVRLAKVNNLSLAVRKAEPDEGLGAYVQYRNGRNKTSAIKLHEDILTSDSVASVAIAAHEVGHAMTHKEYADLNIFQRSFTPSVTSAFYVALWISLAALASRKTRSYRNISLLVAINTLFLFTLGSFFQTLEEANASIAGLASLQREHILTAEEMPEARLVLLAAGSTYASTMVVYGITLGGLIVLSRNS